MATAITTLRVILIAAFLTWAFYNARAIEAQHAQAPAQHARSAK